MIFRALVSIFRSPAALENLVPLALAFILALVISSGIGLLARSKVGPEPDPLPSPGKTVSGLLAWIWESSCFKSSCLGPDLDRRLPRETSISGFKPAWKGKKSSCRSVLILQVPFERTQVVIAGFEKHQREAEQINLRTISRIQYGTRISKSHS
jgi:hypothetical protein